jgi:hypothetical protein
MQNATIHDIPILFMLTPTAWISGRPILAFFGAVQVVAAMIR